LTVPATTTSSTSGGFAGKGRINVLPWAATRDRAAGIRPTDDRRRSIETGWTAMFGIRNLIQLPIGRQPGARADCPGGCFRRSPTRVRGGLPIPAVPEAPSCQRREILGYLLGRHRLRVVDLRLVTMIDAIGGVDINVLDQIYDELPEPRRTVTTIVIGPIST
jgi:hypothetical protein